MKKYLLAIGIICMALTAQAQNRREADLLRKALNKGIPDTSRVHTLIKIADEYCSRGALDSASIYLRPARETAKKYHLSRVQNEINILSARIYCSRYAKQDPKKLFLPLIDSCQKSGDK